MKQKESVFSAFQINADVIKLLVYAVFAEKLLVSTLLLDALVCEHNNATCVAYCGKSVGYGKGCSAFCQLGKGVLDILLALVVKS